MQWGTITWFFLHTFSEKINEDFFTNNREHIIDLTINLDKSYKDIKSIKNFEEIWQSLNNKSMI